MTQGATVKRKVRVKLDDAALVLKGAKLAELEKQQADGEDRYKLIGREHRRKKKELQGKIDTLVEDINNKSEEREVDCRQEVERRLNLLRTYRIDTQELVEERALTTDEIAALPPEDEPQGDGTVKTNSANHKRKRKRGGDNASANA